MEGKRKISVINLILIIMLILCLTMTALMIILSKAKTVVEIVQKSGNKNYAIAEETTNTWDVSANGDGSVMAILADDGTLTISGTGEMKDWEYGATTDWHEIKYKVGYVIIERGVTNIGRNAFYNCYSLTNIKIADTVESIGNYAFSGCQDLINILIPCNVSNIGDRVFESCGSLTSIEVDENNMTYMDDNGVLYTKDGTKIIKYPSKNMETQYTILSSATIIGDFTFEYCENLTNIEIPSGITKIGDYAFYRCYSLQSIKIPKTVTSIGNNAFLCQINNLIEATDNGIELPNILKRALDETDILYSSKAFELTNCTIEDSRIKINKGQTYAKIKIVAGELNGLIYFISHNCWDISINGNGSIMATLSDDGTLTISGTGDMKNWESSSTTDWHVIKDNIKNVIINEGVTNIGSWAFYEFKNLINVKIPNGVINIGDDAFDWCSSLTSIEIPNSVKKIGEGAFATCQSLINIRIPSSVTSIGFYVFGDCNRLSSIEVDENNQNYMDDNGVLYTKDKMELIKYPEGKIQSDYTVLSDTVSIGSMAFYNSYMLTSIEISNSVKLIKWGAFNCCYNLKSIEIPNSVTSIEDGAFALCQSLENIEIPSSITSIGTNAFYGCNNLTIWCKKDSTVHTYAQENEIDYLLIMDRIQPKTTVKQMEQEIGSVSEYKIIDKNGEIITDVAYVTTGCKVETNDGENYIIIVIGDCNGDGQVDIKDILSINKHRLNIVSLTMESSLAGDVNVDGQSDIKDILQINKFRLGKISEL